jgi:hypothetical protein
MKQHYSHQEKKQLTKVKSSKVIVLFFDILAISNTTYNCFYESIKSKIECIKIPLYII